MDLTTVVEIEQPELRPLRQWAATRLNEDGSTTITLPPAAVGRMAQLCDVPPDRLRAELARAGGAAQNGHRDDIGPVGLMSDLAQRCIATAVLSELEWEVLRAIPQPAVPELEPWLRCELIDQRPGQHRAMAHTMLGAAVGGCAGPMLHRSATWRSCCSPRPTP